MEFHMHTGDEQHKHNTPYVLGGQKKICDWFHTDEEFTLICVNEASHYGLLNMKIWNECKTD